MAQQIGLLRQLPRARPPFRQFAGHGEPLPPNPPVVGQRLGDGVPREPVQHGPLLGGTQQSQLVVLPVDGQDLLGQLPEHPHRHRATPEVGTRPAVRANRTHGDHAAVLVHIGPGVGQDLHRLLTLDVGEPPLHDGLRRPRPYLGGVRAPAGQQVQAGDDHRFPGPGLSGDHREPLMQFEGGLLDHSEALDTHLGQHANHRSDSPRRGN